MPQTQTKPRRRAARPKAPPVRFVNLSGRLLTIRVDSLSRRYFLEPAGSRALRLVRLDDGTEYVVGLTFCSCDGFHHRRECKHVDALSALIQKGKVSFKE